MICIDRQLVLDQDPQVVSRQLSDLPAMASMIPNITGWAMPEPDRFVARLRGRLAWVPLRATAQLRVSAGQAPGSLRLEGQIVRGEGIPHSKPGLRSPAFAAFAVRWNVSPSAGGATLDYTLELETESGLEGWIRPLIESRLVGLEAKLARLVGHGRRGACVAA